MRLFLLLIIPSLVVLSCADKPDSPEVLLRIDSAFAEMSEDSGAHKAFKYFAANEVIKFSFETLMKNAGMDVDSAKINNSCLRWTPIKANVSEDGDLGWTAGKWYYMIRTVSGVDTIKSGSYVTFWEKQNDGSWKYIVNHGNLTPDDFK